MSMSPDSDTEMSRDSGTGVHVEARRVWWVHALLGVAAIALGVAALAWPDATIRVVGFLFGLHLLVNGVLRAVLGFVVDGPPLLYRFLAIVFGILTAIVGIVCLRNVLTSAVLLVLFVGIGWLLDGLVEIMLGVVGKRDPLRGWRIGAGVAFVAAGVVVLTRPAPTLDAFVWLGGIVLLVVGIAQALEAIWAARAARSKASRVGGSAAVGRLGGRTSSPVRPVPGAAPYPRAEE
jgi:uncharacterized membrane protein HdeD (DUF308 family)